MYAGDPDVVFVPFTNWTRADISKPVDFSPAVVRAGRYITQEDQPARDNYLSPRWKYVLKARGQERVCALRQRPLLWELLDEEYFAAEDLLICP